MLTATTTTKEEKGERGPGKVIDGGGWRKGVNRRNKFREV